MATTNWKGKPINNNFKCHDWIETGFVVTVTEFFAMLETRAEIVKYHLLNLFSFFFLLY